RSFAKGERMIEIPLGASVVTGEPQPDGTILPFVSTDAVDESLGDTFEEASVRAEKLTVAVYNTTTTSGLAERVARIIDRIGGNVVRIGNEERTIERCQIRVNGDHLNTTTSRMLASIFTCDRVLQVGDSYADVIVAVGSGYESRFVP
ncbi:MAG: LytR C-terminal domain-containing protein, partial [Patescibacteria group bacterium]